jgi:signal transduction histidine kinase
MNQRAKNIRLGTIPQTTLRRMRSIPSYIFLLWRWTWWLFAFIWIVTGSVRYTFLYAILAVTFIQAVIATLYSPIFELLLPGTPSTWASATKNRRRRWFMRRRAPLASGEELEIIPPLIRSRNVYKNIVMYGLDVLICGLAMYFSAVYATPFGNGSPFYRYGFAPVFLAAFVFRYRAGLAAAIGYDLFVLLGVFLHPPLANSAYSLNVADVLGSLFDAPLIAIFTAYMSRVLNSYTRNKRREQDSVRRQKSLLRVSQHLLQTSGERQRFLQSSAEEIRKGNHFARVVVALIRSSEGEVEIDTAIDTGIVGTESSDESTEIALSVARSGTKLVAFEPYKGEMSEPGQGIARMYLPFKRQGDASIYLVLGGETIRSTPFDYRQENFMNIVGTQLVIALENIRLTEQAAELATAAERGRIAREMHDGVAQLVYMLSLNTETCATLVQRLSDTSPENEREELASIAERLDRLVTLSKQALWETRHYMFTLKPLISGTSTLTQMLTNQLSEFESISGLPVLFEVEGSEETPGDDRQRARRQAQVGTAIFRITQEALTNAYKHAGATQLEVCLRFEPRLVEVEICDNGKGFPATVPGLLAGYGEEQRFYSGHGLRGMRERAEELDGTLEVKQRESSGASVAARIPL